MKTMKSFATISLIATLVAAALLPAGCTKDNEASGDGTLVAARITAAKGGGAAAATPAAVGRAGSDAASPATRAVDNRWNRDGIGIIVLSSPKSDMSRRYCNAHYVTSSTGTTAEFTPADPAHTIYFLDPDETVSFQAYAPYQPSATPDALPGTGGDSILHFDTRRQTTLAEQEAVDVLLTLYTVTASKSNPVVSFTKNKEYDASFNHVMSRLVLKFETPVTEGFQASDVERISSVRLGCIYTTGNLKLPAAVQGHNYGFGFGYDENSWRKEWDITKNLNRVETKNGVTQRIYTLIIPSQHITDENGHGMDALPLSITLDGQEYKNTEGITGDATIPGFFNARTSYEYTVRLKRTDIEVTGATIEDWLDGGIKTVDVTK